MSDAPRTPDPSPLPTAKADGFRSGFACFVGRPNAGKSTLTNALVGSKVVITSSKPQTTRPVVRGIVHRPDAQLVLVDTPGLHRPRTLLGERLNDLVTTTWAEVDVVAACLPGRPEDRPRRPVHGHRAGQGSSYDPVRGGRPRPTWSSPQRLAEHLMDIQRLGQETGTDWAEIVPVSAVSGDQVQLLADLLIGAAAGGARRSTPTAS